MTDVVIQIQVRAGVVWGVVVAEGGLLNFKGLLEGVVEGGWEVLGSLFEDGGGDCLAEH